jgi:hypothetical protein
MERTQGAPETEGKERVPLGVSWRNCVCLLTCTHPSPRLNFKKKKMIPSRLYVKQRLFSFPNININNSQYNLRIMAQACIFIARKAEEGEFEVGGKF